MKKEFGHVGKLRPVQGPFRVVVVGRRGSGGIAALNPGYAPASLQLASAHAQIENIRVDPSYPY